MDMPKIDLEALRAALSADDYELVAGIVNPKTGALRASKPPLPRRVATADGYDYATAADGRKGMTAYVWRMVAFLISPIAAHHCMPVMAFCDLPGEYGDDQRALMRRLDALADTVVDTVKTSEWHGVRRWAQVYGLAGTPTYNAEGAVIYI